MKPRLRLMFGVVLTVGLVSAVLVYASTTRKKGDIQFESSRVDRGRIVARVTATGTVSALVTVQVGSQVSGRIKEISVDFSSPVKKGQVIARMDRRLFEAASEQARANRLAAEGNLARAEAQAAEAEHQYGRAKVLAERQLISQAEADTRQAEHQAAVAAITAARGGLEQARASQHQADVNLAYTTIVSPISGIVISRNVDIGQTVAASLTAPTLFTIAEDLRKMQVDTAVSEADVGKLKAKGLATFTVDAYPGEKFRGVIRQIRDAPTSLQNVVTYDAVVDVDNPNLKLKPGMTANVTFVYAERDDVLRLPSAALRFRPPASLLDRMLPAEEAAAAKADKQAKKQEKKREKKDKLDAQDKPDKADEAVWVLRDGRPARLPIDVGVSDGSHVELVSGDVHEGDVVVTDAAVDGAGSGGGKDKDGAGRPKKKSKKLF